MISWEEVTNQSHKTCQFLIKDITLDIDAVNNDEVRYSDIM